MAKNEVDNASQNEVDNASQNGTNLLLYHYDWQHLQDQKIDYR